ncbi:hypothetical protein CVT24_002293 [Panaeolus cyanescens]|uniref:HMG box domain-containing protein n=1 Tax=Panaeolus cyanescens TaxID=181874 RepID=A0A409YIK8_9AGAR|nr:hypothetical protein CVT24_002293 [Panaeolus cyanescens]
MENNEIYNPSGSSTTYSQRYASLSSAPYPAHRCDSYEWYEHSPPPSPAHEQASRTGLEDITSQPQGEDSLAFLTQPLTAEMSSFTDTDLVYPANSYDADAWSAPSPPPPPVQVQVTQDITNHVQGENSSTSTPSDVPTPIEVSAFTPDVIYQALNGVHSEFSFPMAPMSEEDFGDLAEFERSDGTVKRPSNVFFILKSKLNSLLRGYKFKCGNEEKTKLNSRVVCGIAHHYWHSLKEEEQKAWNASAEKLKTLHQAAHPGYVFQPRSGKRKRTTSESQVPENGSLPRPPRQKKPRTSTSTSVLQASTPSTPSSYVNSPFTSSSAVSTPRSSVADSHSVDEQQASFPPSFYTEQESQDWCKTAVTSTQPLQPPAWPDCFGVTDPNSEGIDPFAYWGYYPNLAVSQTSSTLQSTAGETTSVNINQPMDPLGTSSLSSPSFGAGPSATYDFSSETMSWPSGSSSSLSAPSTVSQTTSRADREFEVNADSPPTDPLDFHNWLMAYQRN